MVVRQLLDQAVTDFARRTGDENDRFTHEDY
jgi:hypothetical protein